MPATIVLLTSDASLRASVEKLVSALDHCQLKAMDGKTVRSGGLDSLLPTVVLIHLAGKEDEQLAIEILDRCRASVAAPAVVPIGDHYETVQAVELLARGAADYLARPLDLQRLVFLIDMLTLKSRRDVADAAVDSASGLCCVGREEPFHYHRNEEMGRIVDQLRLLAPLATPVLLSGETGTGKSRLARVFHELSPRSAEPFVTLNCGAMTAGQFEGELLGHAKGSLTGTEVTRIGKLATAGGGTLLLEDIDALHPSDQAKLLRVMDQGVFEPLGSHCAVPVKARIIAATSGSLEDELSAGRFRSDLYYRLNVVTLTLPPLRARRTVISPLTHHFVADIAARHDCPPVAISQRALAAIEAYQWPGNIRQLRNVLERAVLLFRGRQIEPECLPSPLQTLGANLEPSGVGTSKLYEARFDAEFRTLRDALGQNNNNRSRAARHLGISRVTLYKKLHKYDLI